MKSRWAWGWTATYPIFKWLLRIKVHGGEEIPWKGPLIIASNHMSFFDPPLIGHVAKRECFFLAKEELFGQSRFFRWLIEYFNSIPIKRGKAFDIHLFKEVDRLIKLKQAIVIFPEGTRSRSGKFLPFKEGVGLIALRYNIPVVPAYIKNTYRPWQEWFRKSSRVEVFIGKAMYPGERSKEKEKYEAFTKKVEEEIHRLRDIAREDDERFENQGGVLSIAPRLLKTPKTLMPSGHEVKPKRA
jgi:1-acyl-sn-glycerol-3-phosphate acyltransferase